MTLLRYIQAIMLAFIMALPLASCAKEPELVGLTSVVYNYSQETLIFVEINRKQAGRGIEKASLGDVQGGGGSMCCINLAPEWKFVDLVVTDVKGKKYTIRATIEQPWPELVHYAAIHVLPGRKAVIEITPTMPWERMDLLDARLKELRLKK